MVSYGLYVAIDATQNTGKKTSKMVDLIISEVLMPMVTSSPINASMRCTMPPRNWNGL